MEKQQYIHDCENCIFLGHSYTKGRPDLYYCDRADGGSVLARYSNELSDYSSSPISIIIRHIGDKNNPLTKAFCLAVKRGYIKPEKVIDIISNQYEE